METLSLFDTPPAPEPFAGLRLLHTSDWHLGQHFMGKTRQAEHQAFCDWLIGQVREQAVDVVLIAGDIFDTGAPPSYAREQYNRFVVDLRDSGAQLVVLGGNHDSVATLGESRSLLARLGTRVIPAVAEDPEDQLLLLDKRDGSPGALLCAIPFIRPRDVLRSEAGQSAEDKQRSLQEAIAAHYRELFALAERRRADLGGALPIVASGHLTTVGASAGDSVREIYVGALEAFPTNAFPAAAYIALGHIHRPQKVGGLEHIRYCGSPIPLAFDEARQDKQVLLVDLDSSGLRAGGRGGGCRASSHWPRCAARWRNSRWRSPKRRARAARRCRCGWTSASAVTTTWPTSRHRSTPSAKGCRWKSCACAANAARASPACSANPAKPSTNSPRTTSSPAASPAKPSTTPCSNASMICTGRCWANCRTGNSAGRWAARWTGEALPTLRSLISANRRTLKDPPAARRMRSSIPTPAFAPP